MCKSWFSVLVTVSLIFSTAIADDSTHANLGKPAPQWIALEGTDGKLHSSEEYKDAKAILVVFLCNHCPCAKSYEVRFNEFDALYKDRGVKVVAFNSDASENLDAMKKRASDGKFSFDYLKDATQQVGRGFGAQTTPHVFVLNANREIVYSGTFDDDRSGKNVTKNFVVDAIDALLDGREIKITDSSLFGCAIRYIK